MPDFTAQRNELRAMRKEFVELSWDAEDRGDQNEVRRLQALVKKIDDDLRDLVLGTLASAAAALNTWRAELEAATARAKAWPFASSNTPPSESSEEKEQEHPYHDTPHEFDSEDQGPAAEPPETTSLLPDEAPSVSTGWSEEYQTLWDSMNILPQWEDDAAYVAKRIVAHQGRYAAAVQGTSVPWWFVAVVHAMECGLNFKHHLHNGDPLTARTKRVPKNRPPTGAPPFSWEVSARDSISYEKLDKVADWSLSNALFHWHRYNGINNEYKRRGIPTPYLWSGSRHYRKGKYVADGVFDPEAVSGQVGAAVLLKTLINLGAVNLEENSLLVANPAAATEHVPSLSIVTPGPEFAHVSAELEYPGTLARGADNAQGVKRLQEWLNIHDFVTAIDESFGPSTEDQLKAFQQKHGRLPDGVLDEETWSLLTAPLRRALAGITHGTSSFEEAVVRVAQQHISEKPIEVGGNNHGPWVRLYMKGKEGELQRWCAGFVCFIVAQAARDMEMALPFPRQVGVDALVADAKKTKRFIPENDLQDPVKRRSLLRPGQLFVRRASKTDWDHTGLVLALKDESFNTLEGNTGGGSSNDGPNARQGNRRYENYDFLRPL